MCENQNPFNYMTNIEQKIYIVVAQCHYQFFHKEELEFEFPSSILL